MSESNHQRHHCDRFLHVSRTCSIYAHHYPPEAELANTSYREALALAEALGMRPLQAHCNRGLGMLYATIGQPQQARAALAAAIDLYRDMDMTFWLPQTQEALAQVEGQ